jgi:DNA-binding Lrp family transcriptional regulator
LVDAYVLIQTEPGAHAVAEDVQALPGILTAEPVSGPYDVIARTRSASMQDLYGSMLEQIRRVPGVTHALPAPLAGRLIDVSAALPELRAVPAA